MTNENATVAVCNDHVQAEEAADQVKRGASGLNPLYQIGGPRSAQLALKLLF